MPIPITAGGGESLIICAAVLSWYTRVWQTDRSYVKIACEHSDAR